MDRVVIYDSHIICHIWSLVIRWPVFFLQTQKVVLFDNFVKKKKYRKIEDVQNEMFCNFFFFLFLLLLF